MVKWLKREPVSNGSVQIPNYYENFKDPVNEKLHLQRWPHDHLVDMIQPINISPSKKCSFGLFFRIIPHRFMSFHNICFNSKSIKLWMLNCHLMERYQRLVQVPVVVKLLVTSRRSNNQHYLHTVRDFVKINIKTSVNFLFTLVFMFLQSLMLNLLHLDYRQDSKAQPSC